MNNKMQQKTFRNPIPTVDIVIVDKDWRVILIERKNPPFGWAIPGGFIDYGEKVEDAAVREAKEETSLNVELVCLLGVYSDPARDPRLHTISTVFLAISQDYSKLLGADDALQAKWYDFTALPATIAFDHRQVLQDAHVFLQKNPLIIFPHTEG